MLKSLTKLVTFGLAFLGTFSLQRLLGIAPNSYLLPGLISTIVAVIIYKRIFKYRGKKRRLSLFSQSMVAGFAKSCNAPPTIINGWLYFDEIPSLAENIKNFGEKVVQFFPRFRARVEYDKGGYLVWSDRLNFEVKDRIFVHFVDNDQEAHETATRIAATPFQHDCNMNVMMNSATKRAQLDKDEAKNDKNDKKGQNEANNKNRQGTKNKESNYEQISKDDPSFANSSSSPWEIHHIVNLGKLDGDRSRYDTSLLDKSHINPVLNIEQNHNNHSASHTGSNATITSQRTDSTSSTHDIMVIRVDHTIGDGIALLNAFGKLTTDENGTEISSKLFTAPKYTAKEDQKDQKGQASTNNVTNNSNNGSIMAGLSFVWDCVKQLFIVGGLATGKFDTPSSYNQVSTNKLNVYHNTRSVVTVPTIHLDNIKNLKNAISKKLQQNDPSLACTVNDVLFSATSGAFRRLALYNEEQGINTNHTPTQTKLEKEKKTHPIFIPLVNKTTSATVPVTCRALLPLAFPRSNKQLLDPDAALSNQFTFLSADMSIDEMDLTTKMIKIIKTTQELKKGPAALMSFGITKLVTAVLPQAVCQDTAANLFSRHTVVFSNVPGPQGEVYYNNKKIIGIQMIYPNILTQIGIVSLNNHIFMNFTLDQIEMPHSELLGNYLIEELNAMCDEFRTDKDGLPWIEAFSKP